jgi:hypothetical protein
MDSLKLRVAVYPREILYETSKLRKVLRVTYNLLSIPLASRVSK